MKTRIICCAACLVITLCIAAPCMAADVAQGKCISYDAEKKALVIDEYDLDFSKANPYGKSTGKQLTFKLTDQTLVGARPDPGNILRIAFETKGADKVIVRVQNVTKQDIMKK